jgi:hypothetical protein
LKDTLPFSVVGLDEQWSKRELNLVSRAQENFAPHVRKLYDALVGRG